MLLFLYINLVDNFNSNNSNFYNLINFILKYTSYLILVLHCSCSFLEIILIKLFVFSNYTTYTYNINIFNILDFYCIDYFYSFEPFIFFIESKYFYNDFFIFKSECLKCLVSGFFNYSFFNFNVAFVYSFKLTLSLLFLIFIRAGLPRYRYDYLTKLGWSKFLFIILFFFIFFFIIYSLL